MLLLLIFAFVAGIVTILSPCILPILPIVLAGSVTGGKRKPLGIVTGFVGSFTFFTLFLSTLVRILHIPVDTLRVISIVIIFLFGMSLLIAQIQTVIEIFFSKISNSFSLQSQKDGFLAGVLVGLSLGLLWTPCVGPILASVITLALTGTVSSTAIFITLAYSLGTAIPMLIITYMGRSLFQKVPWLISQTKHIQQLFGVVMMATAIGLLFNVDRKFQMFILQTFPNYGKGLTFFEETANVQQQLAQLNPQNSPKEIKSKTGFPTFTMLEDLGKAPELVPGGEWFNLPSGKTSLTIKELRGKVVLVDFWTYSCINCIRTLPYLKDWHEKYAQKGLVIIGVHSPEFEFEKNPKNVAMAIKDFEIRYPVVQDNNFQTWLNFGGNTWPRHYLIDKDGIIREFHSGEGNYQQTEQAIQELISQMGTDVSNVQINTESYQIRSRTPETYLGLARMEGLSSTQTPQLEKTVTFTHPSALPFNTFSLQGDWTHFEEYASPSKNAELQYSFESMNVFLVMKPKSESEVGKVEVYVDDQLQQTVTVDSDRLYELISLPKPGKHSLKLIFLDDHVQVYAFTFG